MTIPDFQSIMLPLLEMFGDSKEHSFAEMLDFIPVKYSLSEQERNELLPSGKQTTLYRPEVQKFVGALAGKHAQKGIFITTSNFSAEAKNYVTNIGTKVVLIDGERLANLMIDYDVGVTIRATYQLKRVDSDYFLID